MPDKRILSDAGRTELTDRNNAIYKGPCIVDDVLMSADGANADCQIYDGVNNKGVVKVHLEALSGTTVSWSPPRGARFEHGIYIVNNATTTKVSVTYEPMSEKKPN